MHTVDCLLMSNESHTAIHSLRILAAVALLLLLSIAPGCRQSSGKVPIHGHVSYRGEAIERASMTFVPKNGRPETASVANGAYATELAPGDYTIAILIGVELPKGYKEGDPVAPPKIVLPDEYTSPNKSTLKATVKAGQDTPI